MINKEKLKLCLLGIQPGSTVPPTRWSIILLLGFEYYFLIDNCAFLEHFAFVWGSWLMGKRFVRNLMWKENILSRNCSASIIFFPYVLIMISKEVFSCGVGGIVLRIAAFQAFDPGSIPQFRVFVCWSYTSLFYVKKRLKIYWNFAAEFTCYKWLIL